MMTIFLLLTFLIRNPDNENITGTSYLILSWSGSCTCINFKMLKETNKYYEVRNK